MAKNRVDMYKINQACETADDSHDEVLEYLSPFETNTHAGEANSRKPNTLPEEEGTSLLMNSS